MSNSVDRAVSPTGRVWRFPRMLGQYRGLVQANDLPCDNGHFGCAAWDNGPCVCELEAWHADDRGTVNPEDWA